MKTGLLINLGGASLVGAAAIFANLVVRAEQPDRVLDIGHVEDRTDMTRTCQYHEKDHIVIQHDIQDRKMSDHFNKFQQIVFGQPEVIELTPELKKSVAGHCPSIR